MADRHVCGGLWLWLDFVLALFRMMALARYQEGQLYRISAKPSSDSLNESQTVILSMQLLNVLVDSFVC